MKRHQAAGGNPKKIHLLSPNITASVGTLKRDILNRKTEQPEPGRDAHRPQHQRHHQHRRAGCHGQAQGTIRCEMHMTHIPAPGDEVGLRRLG